MVPDFRVLLLDSSLLISGVHGMGRETQKPLEECAWDTMMAKDTSKIARDEGVMTVHDSEK